MKYGTVFIICIFSTCTVWGATHLAHIDNRTPHAFSLRSTNSRKRVFVPANSITQLGKLAKISRPLNAKNLYATWRLIPTNPANDGVSIRYAGVRYDLCGMRGYSHEKGPFFIGVTRQKDNNRFDRCVVGPPINSIGLIVEQDADEKIRPHLVPADIYTRILN